MVEKAATLDADAVILDLEDSVPAAEKEATRPLVRRAIDELATAGKLVYVRINPLGAKAAFSQDLATADVAAVVCPNLTGIVFPKVEGPDEIATIDRAIAEQERAQGLPVGQVEVEAILETAKGIVNAKDIAAANPRRVPRLSIGAGDLMVDLGVHGSPQETELFFARMWVPLISRAAGLEPPIDSTYPHIADDEGLRRSAVTAKQLGFQGKQCVHPRQIPIINEVFAPTPEEIDYARRAVAAFDQAVAEGKASTMFEGRMLDYPFVEKERLLLAKAAAIAARARP